MGSKNSKSCIEIFIRFDFLKNKYQLNSCEIAMIKYISMRLQKVFAPLWRVNKYICRHNQFSTKLLCTLGLMCYYYPKACNCIQIIAIWTRKCLSYDLSLKSIHYHLELQANPKQNKLALTLKTERQTSVYQRTGIFIFILIKELEF